MAVLYYSTSDSSARWRMELRKHAPEVELRVWPEAGDVREIETAIVWRPKPGLLASLPNLRMICSLGAGVDHLFGDPDLPHHVPIVRLIDSYMTEAMSEYVLTQVLRLHRQDPLYRTQQQALVWREQPQPNASERGVGVLGLGELGGDAARKLAVLGFQVAGWSRSEKRLPGIESFHGPEGLPALARRSNILICLLPLTSETQGVLDARLFAAMPKGSAIINVGRGAHLVEADLLAALDNGQLSTAELDVFHEEPLPVTHPFWTHPRIVLTPHVAAATNAATAVLTIVENMKRLAAGKPLLNVVDPARQY
jgi:glyoxylate/hydroxypyruvate reductase